MICLRCGYCCKNYLVAIVDKPEKGLVKDNVIVHDGVGIPCKHLRGNEPGNYSCAVHDYSWYKETPCFRHNSVENSPNKKCRIGEYILKLASIHK